jgi:hypothetical protein
MTSSAAIALEIDPQGNKIGGVRTSEAAVAAGVGGGGGDEHHQK